VIGATGCLPNTCDCLHTLWPCRLPITVYRLPFPKRMSNSGSWTPNIEWAPEDNLWFDQGLLSAVIAASGSLQNPCDWLHTLWSCRLPIAVYRLPLPKRMSNSGSWTSNNESWITNIEWRPKVASALFKWYYPRQVLCVAWDTPSATAYPLWDRAAAYFIFFVASWLRGLKKKPPSLLQ